MEKTVNFVNLTPHDINIVVGEETLVIKPSGTVARCKAETITVGYLRDAATGIIIPETESSYGEVYDLPSPATDTVYLVSLAVAKAMPDRKDLRIPNESLRDEAGRVVGCKSAGIVS